MKTRLLLILFLLSISYSIGAQEANTLWRDSIVNVFEGNQGGERAWKVAEVTRSANLNEVDYKVLKPYLDEAIKWEKQNPNLRLLNTIRLGQVNILFREESYVESVRPLQEILQSGEELPIKDSLSTYYFLYDAYLKAHAYAEALEVLRIRDAVLDGTDNQDPFFEVFRFNQMNDRAHLYLKWGKYEKAITQLREVIAIYRENDWHRLAGAYNNMGLAFLKLQEPDSAIFSFEKSREYWKRNLKNKTASLATDQHFFYLLDGNTGVAYNQQGRFREAIPLIRRDIEMFKVEKRYEAQAHGLNSLGQSYNGLNDFDRALEVLDSAENFLKLTPNVPAIQRNLETRIQVMEAMGNLAEAYPLHKQLVAFKDSIAQVESRARLAVLEVVYEVDKKNREIEKQRLMTLTLEANNHKQRVRLLAMLVAVSLLSVILFFLVVLVVQRRKRNRYLTKKNEQIESQKQIISKALGEKEMLLKEIHHRVKNNLQLISGIFELQSTKFEDSRLREIMEEGQGRIKSMALIHEQLYENVDLGQVDLEDYISRLAKVIASTFSAPDQDITLKVDVEHLDYDLNLAVPLGLIVNELITNCYKHAFKGRKQGVISIRCKSISETTCEMEIQDDGLGLPKSFDPAKSKSLGLRLVRGLSSQMEGSFRAENDSGAHFYVQFKNRLAS